MFNKTRIIIFIILFISTNIFSQVKPRCGTFTENNLSKFATNTDCSDRPDYHSIIPVPVYTLSTSHFLIHYTLEGNNKISNINYAISVGNYAEASWDAQCNVLGWIAPPADDCGGDSKYDIYIQYLNFFGGVTTPEGSAAAEFGYGQNSMKSYISIANDLTDAELSVAIAHEFNHALQFSYNGIDEFVIGNIWIYESCATWMEDYVFDSVNDWITTFLNDPTFPTPLSNPEISLTNTGGNLNTNYSTALFWHMLTEWKNDNNIVKKVWERNGSTGGWALTNINYILSTYYSSTIEQALKEYAVWRYYCGSNNDGNHFSEADLYPNPTITEIHTNLPASGSYSVSSPGGARYIKFNPNSWGTNILFNGADNYDWAAFGIYKNMDGTSVINEIALDGYMAGNISPTTICQNSSILAAVATEFSGEPVLSFSYTGSSLPSSQITFWNETNTTNLGGQLKIDNTALVNSGNSFPLVTQRNYSLETLNERFSYYKHNNWNEENNKYLLSSTFSPLDRTNQKAKFSELKYANVTITGEIPSTTNFVFSFNDPWYVKSDGTQHYPSNSTDKYWINATNGFYEPNGKDGATEKGVFLGQNSQFNPSLPIYSVKTTSPQTIYVQGKNRNFYFQNWESSGATFQNSYNLETPVVFNQAGATVKAVMKGTGISNNGSSYNNNNQRKIVKTLNGYLHAVYESMGHVWYERSIDNGSTWALMNNAKPISGYSGKSPSLSIDSQDNDYFFLVYQEEVPTATLTERAIVVSRIKYTGVITYSEMVATLISSSTVLDCEPVISSSEEDYLVVYKVLNSTSGQNDGLYYYLYTRAADPNVFNYSSFGLVQQTTAVSVHPSLVSLNITHTPSDYHIVWQQGSTSGSSSIKYTKMVWNGQAMSFLYYSEPSSTSGYASNFNPSIAITLNRPRVVWLTENPYTYILEGNLRTGNLNTWGTLTRFSYGSGCSVESINVNARNVDYGFVVGYAGDGQAVRYYKPSVNLVAQPTRYDNYVQLSNGVNYTDMAIQTFNTASAPYYFNSTTVDATLSKTSSANEAIKGREIVFNNGKSNLIFEVNNIKVDENAIDFVEIEDTTVTKSNEEAISLFETESFSLTDKSNFSFDVNYTLIDKENLEEQFGFEYQLVDANTNLAIGVLEKIETSKLDSEEESSVSYTINTEGIGNKQVKLKLVVAKDVADNVAIISTFSTKSDLAKSSNKVISFDETLSITDYALEQNYPNPFNPSTIIKYQIPNDGLVTMKIYDITGQEVKTLVNESQTKGRYEINFDASNLSTGVYFYRLTSGSFTKSMKMLLIK